MSKEIKLLKASEIPECIGCRKDLNPICIPARYGDDLDPRTVDGGRLEFCAECYENVRVEYCNICDDEYETDDLCRHLFFDLDWIICGPGSSECDEKQIYQYIKPSFIRFLKTIADTEIENDHWYFKGENRLKNIYENFEKLAHLLERDNFYMREGGSIFGADWIELKDREYDGETNLFWMIPTRRFYDKRDQTHDGACWLMCLGTPSTHFWNIKAAEWIRESLPQIVKKQLRWIRLTEKTENKAGVRV